MHYLYGTYKLFYPQCLTLQESDHGGSFRIDNAFDFDYNSDSYWISSNPNGFISICLKYHSFTVESFEITTTSGTCRPSKFSIKVGMDGDSYLGQQNYSYTMGADETAHFTFDFNNIDVRCFKFQSIQSTCSFGPDINQVEFFGKLTQVEKPDGHLACENVKLVTCPMLREREICLSIILWFYS